MAPFDMQHVLPWLHRSRARAGVCINACLLCGLALGTGHLTSNTTCSLGLTVLPHTSAGPQQPHSGGAGPSPGPGQGSNTTAPSDQGPETSTGVCPANGLQTVSDLQAASTANVLLSLGQN